MNLINPFVIITAYNHDNAPSDNERRLKRLQEFLDENCVRYKMVDGYYNGNNEVSALIPWCRDIDPLLHEILVTFDQECYLSVSASGYGYLIDKEHKATELGKLREVPRVTDNCFLLDGKVYQCA